MKISYYLVENRTNNLYCRISDGSKKVTFSLGHKIHISTWNTIEEEGSYQDEYYYTLYNFKRHLQERYNSLKAENKIEIINILKTESTLIIDGDGIQGIARNLFNNKNKRHSIPQYDDFLKAFENFSKLSRKEYRAQTVEKSIYFRTEKLHFKMTTIEGRMAELKSIIDGKFYSEITTETDENIWSDIYLDAGIEKWVFLPVLLREWEEYWEKEYKRVSETGKATTHLVHLKDFSWKQFQIFMECYDSAGDIIKLAVEIDDFELYPLVVISMLKIFDPTCCYSEYCDFEFSDDEWECIFIEDDNDDSPLMFYIKEIDSDM